MSTLLCTAKYRKTFALPEKLIASEIPEGALGPWYANTLNLGPLRLLHYMSSPSLLSVMIPLRERHSAEQRFASALADVLRAIGVVEDYIEKELVLLSTLQYSRASDRSKLGSLLDQAHLASYRVEDLGVQNLHEVSLRLAETPCAPMSYDSPEKVAPQCLEQTWRWTARR